MKTCNCKRKEHNITENEEYAVLLDTLSKSRKTKWNKKKTGSTDTKNTIFPTTYMMV